MEERPPASVHAIVCDPPYGKEFGPREQAKLRAGRGGVWRQPPRLGGYDRMPLPRFTVLGDGDRASMRAFFSDFGDLALRVLVPGGHLFVAANPLVSHVVYGSIVSTGFEKRGEIIRLVQTLRGGDRPKGAEQEFAEVTAMPRAAWEPWGLFRKACEGTLAENLRRWGTGGLRRESRERPFTDVIPSSPTPARERRLSPHPSLKPQHFMRQVVRAALPLGRGVILDPFMGGGSTIAAALAIGYESIGLERDPQYFAMAVEAVPKLAALK
jgi:site-specific DNA-methyltransferase (adenine-specific)